MPAPLPLCVIGGGSIGLRHAEQASKAEGVHLTAVVEPDEGRRSELTRMGLPATATLDDAPADTQAAVIATPTGDHLASGLAALAKGCAILVEKPLTMTLDEADQLIAAADAAALPLLTGHHRRCHPFIAATRAALPDLGPLVGIQGLWSLRKHDSYYDPDWRRSPGAGPIQTNLSHEIDLLRLFAGEITQVQALTSSATRGLAIEDTAALSFRFASGTLGNILISDAGASPWSFEAASGENPAIAPSGQDYLRFVGTRGALEFPSLTRWKGDPSAEIEWSKPLTRTPGPALDRIDPIREQLTRFARVVRGTPDPLLATGRDGRATVAVIDAVLRAAETGQTTQVPQ